MLNSLRKSLSAAALLAFAMASAAQQVAVPPLIKMVVPSSPGASTDIMARAVAKQLGERLGNTVIVDNKPGGSGFIGASAVARGPRDGSNILFFSVSLVTTAATMKNVPVDVIHDLIPVAILGEGPLTIAVSSNTDIKTPADLVAAARAKPDSLTYGSAGVGTLGHLAGELLNDSAKIQLKHIPYKGAALASGDLAGGTIDAMIAVNSTFAAQVKAGRARLIAVTSLQPSPAFPGVPTMASVVPGYEVNLWTVAFVPAGTPPALVQRLNREINEISSSKELRGLMLSDGALPVTQTPEQVSARVRETYAAWKKLASMKNIVAD